MAYEDLDQMAQSYGIDPEMVAMNDVPRGGPLPPGMLAAMAGGSPAASMPAGNAPLPPLPAGTPGFAPPGVNNVSRETPVAVRQSAFPGVDLAALLDKYNSGASTYAPQLQEAMQRSREAQSGFNKTLDEMAATPANPGPSQAEMYFKLASALAQPTKTGSFAETLGNAGGVLGAHAQEQRTADMQNRQQSQQIALQRQKLALDASKGDETALRQLVGEEMKDKRATSMEILKEYVKSGQPQSQAGKDTMDMGLTPGTPAFQDEVKRRVNLDIEGKLAKIDAANQGLALREANLKIAQMKQAQLTPTEMKLKDTTQQSLQSGQASANLLLQALELNKNSMTGSLADKAQRKVLEAMGSEDPTLVSTQNLENLLSRNAMTQLKSTFAGSLSDKEGEWMKSVQGINSKNQAERDAILRNGLQLAAQRMKRDSEKLQQINSGQFRLTAPGQ